MSYPTCLLTLKCLFYSDLPQTTINKAINDLCKRLNARVLDILRILWELGSRTYYGITSSKSVIIE